MSIDNLRNLEVSKIFDSYEIFESFLTVFGGFERMDFQLRSVEGYRDLKRFLSILSDLIFESRVEPGIPSLAAAPDGPETLPPLSRKAASIISFSSLARVRD